MCSKRASYLVASNPIVAWTAPFNLVPWKKLLTYPGHFLQAGTPKELGCKMKLQFDELWIGKSNLEIGSSIPKQSPNLVYTHCGNLLLLNGYGSLHLSGYENLLLRSNEDRLNGHQGLERTRWNQVEKNISWVGIVKLKF
jgi:hypothetical protein